MARSAQCLEVFSTLISQVVIRDVMGVLCRCPAAFALPLSFLKQRFANVCPLTAVQVFFITRAPDPPPRSPNTLPFRQGSKSAPVKSVCHAPRAEMRCCLFPSPVCLCFRVHTQACGAELLEPFLAVRLHVSHRDVCMAGARPPFSCRRQCRPWRAVIHRRRDGCVPHVYLKLHSEASMWCGRLSSTPPNPRSKDRGVWLQESCCPGSVPPTVPPLIVLIQLVAANRDKTGQRVSRRDKRRDKGGTKAQNCPAFFPLKSMVQIFTVPPSFVRFEGLGEPACDGFTLVFSGLGEHPAASHFLYHLVF